MGSPVDVLIVTAVPEEHAAVLEAGGGASAWTTETGSTGLHVAFRDFEAAGVLLSPAELDRLSERARFVAAVEEGLADADAGRVRDHDEVAARMKERFGSKRPR